jgi:Fe-S oxidoreductase
MKLFLDWSSYQNAGLGDAYADIPKTGGDFAKAVAVCINSRQCEQTGKGVMCPSYRVTGNPLLSPGGRVKMLKQALNAGDESALSSQDLAEAMDLCVSCKGCKRECENELDMALIKAEYLGQLNQQNGIALRRQIWAHLPSILSWPFSARLVNLRNRHVWLAKLADKWLGISAKIKLPVPVKSPKQPSLTESSSLFVKQSEELVLFVDTFNRRFQPEIAEAATKLLQAAGYKVHLLGWSDDQTARNLCCGRTYFNNGLLDQARQQAQHLLQVMEPHLLAGRWVIGLEPSCILSLRDEYLKMHLGESAVNLAERVLLLEEFIAREQTAKRWTLGFKSIGQRVLVHGHCHQKAVGAMKSMRKVLKSVEDLDFDLIESSCCGMAGHFGLESEHVSTAQAMAEQALFPSLRAEPQALVVANGFSCQQQIDNGGFTKPLHIAQLLIASIATVTEAP